MESDAELVEQNMGLMRWAIMKAAPGRDTAEFLGVAYLALRRSGARFDARRGTWESLLIRCVTNAVRDALRRERRHRGRSEPIEDDRHVGAVASPQDVMDARDDARQLAEAIVRIGEERGSRRGHVAILMARGVPLRQIGTVIGCTSPSSMHKHSQAAIEDLTDFMGSEQTSRIDRRKGTRAKGPGPATTRRAECKIGR